MKDGALAVVRSRRGAAHLRVRVSDRVAPGVAFAPFHWGACTSHPATGRSTVIVSPALDPISRQAELKATRGARARRCPVAAPSASTASGAEAAPAGDRLLVVGTGMAAVATVEAALAHDAALAVTMVGPRARAALRPRRALAPARRQVGEARLALQAVVAGSREHGVRAAHRREVAALDLGARVAASSTTASGARLRHARARDRLAACAAADRPGSIGAASTRSARSPTCAAILAAATRASRAVVIGGGLLGIEAARGAARAAGCT